MGPSIWNRLSNDLKFLNTTTLFTQNYKKLVLKKLEGVEHTSTVTFITIIITKTFVIIIIASVTVITFLLFESLLLSLLLLLLLLGFKRIFFFNYHSVHWGTNLPPLKNTPLFYAKPPIEIANCLSPPPF